MNALTNIDKGCVRALSPVLHKSDVQHSLPIPVYSDCDMFSQEEAQPLMKTASYPHTGYLP